jgi:hypothetical protein
VSCDEAAGRHEVFVADPGFAPMYAAHVRTLRTDRRDARRATVEAVDRVYPEPEGEALML